MALGLCGCWRDLDNTYIRCTSAHGCCAKNAHCEQSLCHAYGMARATLCTLSIISGQHAATARSSRFQSSCHRCSLSAISSHCPQDKKKKSAPSHPSCASMVRAHNAHLPSSSSLLSPASPLLLGSFPLCSYLSAYAFHHHLHPLPFRSSGRHPLPLPIPRCVCAFLPVYWRRTALTLRHGVRAAAALLRTKKKALHTRFCTAGERTLRTRGHKQPEEDYCLQTVEGTFL